MKRYMALFLALVMTVAQFGSSISVKAASDGYVMNPDFFTTDGGTYNATSAVTTFGDDSVLAITPDAGQSGDIQIDRWNLAGCNISASDYQYVTADYYYEAEGYTGGSLTGWNIAGEVVDNKEESASLSANIGPTVMKYDANVVGEANPEYVACLAGKWQMFRQSINPTAGKTYVLTCDYYMPANATGSIRFYGGSSGDLKQQWISGGEEGKVGTAVLEYTATGTEGWFAAGAQQDSDTDGYYWNFCVTEKNSSTNLLSNGDFATGDFTSWDGYDANDAVVSYNEETMGDSTPEYMLKLYSTYTNAQDETSTWKEVYQSYAFTPGKTYVFTCDYYMPAGAQGHVSMRSGSGANEVTVSGGAQGNQGSVRLEYTTQTSDDWATAVLMQNTNEGGEGYYWNLRVTEKDSDVNVLQNADFTIDDVTVNMPENMVIRLCEQGDSENIWSDWKASENAIVANEWSQITFDVSGFDMTNNYCQMHFFPWGMSDYSKGNTASGVMHIKNITFLTELPGTSDDDNDNDNDNDDAAQGNQDNQDNQDNPGETPEYMAKLVGTYVDASGTTQQWKEVNQFVTPEAGKTYEFSFDYYVPDEGTVEGRLMGVGWTIRKQVVSTAGEVNTAKITYTATASDEWIAPLLSKDTEGVAYVWNLCFKEVGQTENLLQNADFSEGNGSWIGWQIGGQNVQDAAASEAITAAYGHEIMAYDASLFGTEDDNDNDDIQPPVQDSETTDTKYMAKLIGTYVDASGVTQQWKEVNQFITPQAGKTYEFTYSYYVPDAGTLEGRIMGDGWVVLANDVSVSGKIGTAKITYTAKSGDSWVSPLLSKDMDGIAYVWDLCFKEVGQTENLLQNADFSEGNGSWIGWEIAGQKISDKATSDQMTASFGHAIMKYDETLLGQGGTAEGGSTGSSASVTSKIPSGDPTYMAKLIGSYVDSKGVTQQWKEVHQIIMVEVGKTYEFSYSYFVPGSGGVEGRIMGVGWTILDKAVSETGEIGTVKITYKAQAGDEWVAPLLSKDTEGIAYVWNLCFNEVGQTVNLLQNADFSEGNGSWIGWEFGGMKGTDKASSDAMTAAFGHEVVKFNKTLFEKEKGNASVLNSAINPNANFSFADNGKYKTLDTWSVDTESGSVTDTDTDANAEPVVEKKKNLVPVICACSAALVAGAGAVIVLLKRKKI